MTIKPHKSQHNQRTVIMSVRIPIELFERIAKVAPPTDHIGWAPVKTRNSEIVKMLYRWVEEKEQVAR